MALSTRRRSFSTFERSRIFPPHGSYEVKAPLIVCLRYTEDDAPPKAEPADVKTEDIETAISLHANTKEEAPDQHEEQNGDGDQKMYGNDEDVDDEIDFNLGGNGPNYDSPANHEAHGPGIKEDG